MCDLYETAQALIIYARYRSLYSLYLSRYPAYPISFATFKKLRPWYVRRAKEESCLCKQCENFKQQQYTLSSIAELLKPLQLPSPGADGEDAPEEDNEVAEAEDWVGGSCLEKLIAFCELESKAEMVKHFLCEGAFQNEGKQACINGSCQLCGFKNLWSNGLRQHVVDKEGNVRSSAPVPFQSVVEWVRIRSSKPMSNPPEPNDTRYETRQGTVVQFLDEFERETARKFPHHRFTISRQKSTDAQFNRNRWPGWLGFAVDFAMDGTIPPPQGRSMQSDHWSPMSYTLFVNIVSWLRTDKWICRTSSLAVGDAVTVESDVTSQPNATEPSKGSYWAEVISLPSLDDGEALVDPSLRVYGVRRHGVGAEGPLDYVERRFLRPRVLHLEAFVHVSDDKTHDSHAAQLFINKTINHLHEHYVETQKERFTALRVHSDNAPSHFKSSKTMHFLTQLPSRLQTMWGAASEHSFRVVWDFGAPGHGKGVWDGIGAWMKRTVRQDVVDHKADRPTVHTSDGHILSAKQVFEHLQVFVCAPCNQSQKHCWLPQK